MYNLKNFLRFSSHKAHPGFTIFESMAALLIMGIFVTAILTSQGTILNRIYRHHNDLQRVPLINNIFFNPDNYASIVKEEPVVTEVLSPTTRMRLSGIASVDGSSLHGMKGLRVLQAEATWDELFDDTSMIGSLVMFDTSWIKPPEES